MWERRFPNDWIPAAHFHRGVWECGNYVCNLVYEGDSPLAAGHSRFGHDIRKPGFDTTFGNQVFSFGVCSILMHQKRIYPAQAFDSEGSQGFWLSVTRLDCDNPSFAKGFCNPYIVWKSKIILWNRSCVHGCACELIPTNCLTPNTISGSHNILKDLVPA